MQTGTVAAAVAATILVIGGIGISHVGGVHCGAARMLRARLFVRCSGGFTAGNFVRHCVCSFTKEKPTHEQEHEQAALKELTSHSGSVAAPPCGRNRDPTESRVSPTQHSAPELELAPAPGGSSEWA